MTSIAVLLIVAPLLANAKSLCGSIQGHDPYSYVLQRVVRSTDSAQDVVIKQALVKYLVSDASFTRVCVKSGRLLQDEDDGDVDGAEGAAAGALDNTNVLTGVRRILANVFTGNLIGVIQESVGLRSPEGVSNVFTDVLSTIFGSNATAGVTGILANVTSSTPGYNGSVPVQQYPNGQYPGVNAGVNTRYPGNVAGVNAQYLGNAGVGQHTGSVAGQGLKLQYLGAAGVGSQYPGKLTSGTAQYGTTGTAVQTPGQYNNNVNSVYTSYGSSGSSYSLGGRRRRKTTPTPEFQEDEEDDES